MPFTLQSEPHEAANELDDGLGLFQFPTIQLELVPEFEQKKLPWIVGTFEIPDPSVFTAEPLAEVFASKVQFEMNG
jgi:hypothetical protein